MEGTYWALRYTINMWWDMLEYLGTWYFVWMAQMNGAWGGMDCHGWQCRRATGSRSRSRSIHDLP
jgi:hypothetical protein